MIDPTVVAALIAFLATIAAAVAGLYWNFVGAREQRKLPFLTKQLELCFETSELAARLAVCEDEEVWKATHGRFFELYFGPLAIVEDNEVAGAMMRFALALESEEGEFPASGRLNGPALDLSEQIRKLILRSWDVRELGLVLDQKA